MYTTLNSIINRYIVRRKESDQSNYDLYLSYAILAAKELHVYADNAFKTVVLTVDPNTNTAQLPQDFVDWSFVGGCINGKMYTLDYRRDLCTPEQELVCDSSGNLVSEQDQLAAINDNQNLSYNCNFTFNGVQYGDECIDNYFSVGAGFPSLGLFKINKEKNRIHIANASVRITEFVLVYKSNGVEKGKDVYIDETYEFGITAYISYHVALDNDKPNVGAKKEEWRNQFNRLKYSRHSITMEQLIKSARKYVGTGILQR